MEGEKWREKNIVRSYNVYFFSLSKFENYLEYILIFFFPIKE